MPKYLCLQRNLPGGKRQRPSPVEMQAMYAQFGAWMEKFKSAENLDEAITIARACPGLVGPGSGVEVIEIHSP